MEGKEKVISLYNYISEVTKNSKSINKNISEEKWNYFLNNLPVHQNIIYNNFYDENNAEIILSIKKPNFLKPLVIEKDFLPWINGDWKNFKDKITIKEERVIEKISFEEGTLPFVSEVEKITDDVKNQILKKIEKRNIWVEEQKNIERVRKIFDDLYIQYLDLNKESDTLEILLANGLVKIKNNNVYYPILLKKVKIDFNAEDNILNIRNLFLDEEENNTQLYTEFLNEIENINLMNILKLTEKIKEKNIYPLNEDEIDNFFREFIHELSMNGYYEKDIENFQLFDYENNILIEDNPIFFIRKKESGVIKAIDEVIKNIEESGEIPEQLRELVGINQVEKVYDKTLKEKNLSSKEILFVKDTNNEQLEIAERIEKYNAVVVQGPPGTGKTHTIANLLGHFLAQGKNILVTSQTKKALKVLKDKIPKNIQGLCISILDDNNSDMARSVENITEAMGRMTSEKLKKDVDFIQNERTEEYLKLKKLKNKIFAIKYKENQSIFYNGESFSIKEVGIYLCEKENTLNKIKGNVVDDSPCPIDNEELKFLNNYRNSVSFEEEKEIELNLLDYKLLKTKNEFQKILENIEKNKNDLESVSESKNFYFNDKKFFLNNENIVDLEKFKNFNFYDILPSNLKSLKNWKLNLISIGATNETQRKIWEHFLTELEEETNIINEKAIKFFDKSISYEPLKISEAEILITKLKEAKKNPGIIFKTHLTKAKKELGSKILLNNKIIEEIEECDFVLEYLKIENKKLDLKRKWDSFNIEEFHFEDILNSPNEIINIINYYLYWYRDQKENFISSIEKAGINPNIIFNKDDNELLSNRIKTLPDKIKKLEKILLIAHKAFELLKANQEYEEYQNFIINSVKINSIVENGIKTAVESKNIESYGKYVSLLKNLSEKTDSYNKYKVILNKISNVAEEWAEEIKNGNLIDITDIYEAWKWKQLSQKLENLEKEPYELLQEQVRKSKEELKNLTLKLVEKKSWYHILSFIEKKENLQINQALRGWKQSMEKIGKGTGKNAEFYRKQAKEKITLCQKAVPAWIMPMNKVIDTLNPGKNKFDIVIVDEASQADISALVLLYMAKKVIIVGDDKQVSPSAVGEKIEKQNILRDKYLKGIISNDDLYGTRSSLYSIASTTYQPLMLREHFRCVPEIIGYSNKTSYDYKIKPLRETYSSKLKPAVINYRVDGEREEKSKINKVEAETIISLISSCLEERLYENSTFGIISLLGQEQVEYIQKLLVEKIGTAEIEKHNILCGDSSHFQGDERDVIFLSMVDSNKNSSTPLIKKTEGTDNLNKKKYNVAASRAKDQMWIVHSLDFRNDLKDGDIRKELLEFGENQRAFMQDDEINSKSDSIFEEEVAKYLSARNYNIKQQWEVGAYRIDMVVSYRNEKVAIECDGERWHSSEEQIKNDIERQDVLERCGWNFIRIRGSKYFRNPVLIMEEVEAELNKRGIYPEEINCDSYEDDSDNDLINKIKTRANDILLQWKNEKEDFLIQNNAEIIKEINDNNFSEQYTKEEKKQKNKTENLKSSKKSAENSKQDIFSFLNNENIEYIDNRKLSGLLWIIYNSEKKEKIENFLEVNKCNYSFDRRGTKATSNRKAWRVKMEE